MSFIGEGIDLWIKIIFVGIMLIVPSMLFINLMVGGAVMKETGNEAAGETMETTGNIISSATTVLGNLILAIFTNPITILLCIGFAFYMKYIK